MRTRQLADLRSDVVWLADLPTPSTTTFITTAALNDRINEGFAELFRIIVGTNGKDAYAKTATIATAASTSLYDLPSDFYELTRCSLLINTGDLVALTRFTEADRPFLASSTPGWNGEPFRYSIQGKPAQGSPQQIELLPIPASTLSVQIAYVYGPARLVGDNDVVDGFAGFEDYAVNFAARRCALKGEDFDLADRLAGELDRLKADVLASSKQVDALNPPRVQMTRGPGRFGRRWR